MKIKVTIFVTLLFCAISTVSAVDQMTITVEAAAGTFDRRPYENGALMYTNRIYTLVNACSDFSRFDMLASNGGEANTGTIIPSSDGYIYMLARSGGLSGWTEIANSQSMILTVQLSVYQKAVTAGQRIAIPNITNFQGATPLAKRIIYGAPTVTVKGEYLDIKDSAVVDDYVFAQNEDYTFKSIPAYLSTKKYAFSTSDRPGAILFSSYDTCTVYVALNNQPSAANGWVKTGETVTLNKLLYSIPVSTVTYYIYKYKYTDPSIEIALPATTDKDPNSSLFFADKLMCGNVPQLPGIIITRSLDSKYSFITNPSITILPDGDYLAACTGAYRVQGTSAGVSFFLSSDKGLTWKAQSINNGVMSYQNLFVHKGTLYLMGTSGVQSDVIIRTSTDKGVTWTYPTNSSDGILLTGQYHSAPVPMAVHNGRIWRAFETNVEGENKTAFVMSAPVDADLMNATNWAVTNALSYNTNWISGDGKSFKQWLEGNVVVDKNGNIVNVLRVDEEKYGGVAAIATVTGTIQLSFNPSTDIIHFPGGGKKFTIRYDNQSNFYWTISNAEFDEDRTKTQAGVYSSGTHCGLLRNRLVLMSSPDLRNWTIKDTLISYDNPFLNGFQYVDWLFEGDDIIAVSRTAFQDERGLPVRQHDGNYFLFHRFTNFRGVVTSVVSPNHLETEFDFTKTNKRISIKSKEAKLFDTEIFDCSGKIIYFQKNNSEILNIDVTKFSKGIYVLRINQKENSFSKKIII
ncbi:MAG: T9SS type A sorting domain-containing protein [Paludibacteraceae bacterium]